MQVVVEQLRAAELLGANAAVFVCDAAVLDRGVRGAAAADNTRFCPFSR